MLRGPKNFLEQKNKLAWEHWQNEGFGAEPIFAEGLKTLDGQKFSNLAGEAGMGGAEEFELDEINSAGGIETMRDLYSARLQIDASFVASGQNEVVVSGLQLHPAPGRFPAVVVFAGGERRFSRARPEPLLDLSQAAEIVAGRGKIMLAEELVRRMDFIGADGRSGVNAEFQALDQAFRLPSFFFRRHA